MSYREQLWVPWWWWPLGVVVSGSVAYTVSLAFRPFPYWIPALVCAGIAVLAMFGLSRQWVEVDDSGELRVGKAHIPLALTSRCALIGPREKSAALGRQLDPAAFVAHRSWVPALVLVVLDDPSDPTPYWLFSSAHPEKLIEVIEHWQNARPGNTPQR
ncbi:conserved hypothetical protein [Segniliparus rotundus DSM 44985]|uniref:DUF3093 domain-containing protein n=1 Tax=Segniliparus rotundus (strain ATCC BAA-972 / CDC 1076 / CIP 108378 / DSM 44985 / JCM 13578) TaxID=640132 RepID=D6ZER5_SEGRD|nr:DUF3093 domain-containing protein [Segniliparus rotundus]ADG97439.1 conserved hypothetical protein [Segniliparus rotundus DSM 44985]